MSDASQILGRRYRVERELGSGGMATVYLALDLKHNRQVAIKVLRSELAATLGAERFSREIATTASFQHPHILPLLDSGHSGDLLFYVMPYVAGESLRARLARERELPMADVVRILIDVVDALAYAHAHQVVHRDIKPENVLLSQRHALVTDFGVAKAVSDAALDHSITTAGLAIGTPAYMAPEQAAADPNIDARADIYAVGVLGYELITGRPPFANRPPAAVLAAHITERPESPDRLRPACPASLAHIVMKCLEKRPDDRWQTCDELLVELESLATPASGTHFPAARRRIRPWVIAGAVALALVGGWMVATERPQASLAVGQRVQVTLDPGLEIDPALSPDGRLIAYVGNSSGELKLYVRQLGSGASAIPVVRDVTGWQRLPSWSPDGRQLLYLSQRGIELVPALGGPAQIIVPAPRVTAAGAVAPDGAHFAYANADSIYIAAVGGGRPRFVTAARDPHSFAWSPDAKRLAFVSGNSMYLALQTLGNIATSSIWTVRAQGGEPVRATDDVWFNASPVWTHDGGSLLFLSSRAGGRDVFQQHLNRSGRPEGPPVQLTTGLSALTIGLSADGKRLAYALLTETSNVWSLQTAPNRSTSIVGARPLTRGDQTIEGFDISPDGQWLAFDSNRGGVQQIFKMHIPGGEPRQLTNDSNPMFFPAWSPDGREIGFHGYREQRRQLFVIPAEGGTMTQLTTGPSDHRGAQWLGNGRTLGMVTDYGTPSTRLEATTRGPDGHWSAPRVAALVVSGDTLRGASLGVGAWSPDGRLVARLLDDAVVVAPGAGGAARRIAVPARPFWLGFPRWSEDDRWLYYAALDSNGVVGSVVGVPVNGGAARVVVRFDDPTRPWHRYGFVVRGRTFYFTLGDLQSDVWVAEIGRGR